MIRNYKTLFFISLCFFSVNVFAADGAEDCSGSGGLNYICGLAVPEDLVIIPGTDWVVAGAYSKENTAGLFLVDAISKNVTELYSPQAGRNRLNRNLYGACPGRPDLNNFQTHGLAIQTEVSGDETYNFYVVSHGGREAIEVFELDASSD